MDIYLEDMSLVCNGSGMLGVLDHSLRERG